MSEQDETQEVLNFLQEMQNSEESNESSKAESKVEAKVELSREEMEELGKSFEEEKDDKKVEVNPIPVRDDFKKLPQQDMFSLLLADIGEVTVSDYEKDMFIKAVLNDTQFYTTSKILGGRLNIEVKSRTMYTDKLVFDALNYDEKTEKIAGVDSMLYRLQMYVAACQLKSYGKKNVELHLDPSKSFDENYVKLNDHMDTVLSQIPSHVWAAIVMGVRIHEYKSKICMDNLNNENFWVSAGINS